MRPSRILLSVAAAVALGATQARADEPYAPPAFALGAIRDMGLKVRCTRALSGDRVLGPLRLTVEVSEGVAVLRGDVPNAEVAKQAKDKLETLNGILAVRSELRVAGRTAARPAPDLSVPRLAPPKEFDPGAIKTRATVVGGEGLKAGQPGPLVLPGPTAKAKSPPATPTASPKRSAERTQSAKPVPAGELRAAVAAISENSRYRGIPVRVNGDVVIVTRRGNDEDVAALIQALRRVPGVSEVIRANE